jgi:hypothetical protein
MKKSVMLMASILAVALAGSAQAATMFAVQNAAGTQDMAAITDTGDITAVGKFSSGLNNVPVGSIGTAIAGAAGTLHVATLGGVQADASLIAQHTSTSTSSAFAPAVASNFAFYRINKNTTTGAYSLPAADNILGMILFGAIDITKDANVAASRKNIARFDVRAEGTWASITNSPTYFTWANAAAGVSVTEKMRLTSAGNLGIGTTAPTSKLHVVGLPVEATPGVVPAGLTTGAFYRTAAGVVMVAP